MIKGDPQWWISFSLHHIQGNEIFPDGKVKLLRSEVMLRIVKLPFGQLRYHFVMIKIQMGLLYE